MLLNGDAEFQFVRAFQRAKVPRVVAMTAMHHGALYEGTTSLKGDCIPFAPGSRAARAALRFRDARINGALTDSTISIVTEAALALQRRRLDQRRRELRVQVSRVARAAAIAVHAVEQAYPGQVIAKARKFAAVAAAAAVAALRHPDPRVIGLAAFLASTVDGVSTRVGMSPLETVIEVALRTIANPAMATPDVTSISCGGLDGELLPHVANIAAALVAAGAPALTPDQAGAEAASSLGELWGSYKNGISSKKAKDLKNRIDLFNGDEGVINDLATAATAAILASRRGAANRHALATACDAGSTSVGVPGGQLGTVRARVLATLQSSYWAAPALARDLAALDAARWAGERIAATMVGTDPEAVRAVIHAARTPARRREAYHAFGSKSLRSNGAGGHIAYSYGVNAADFTHGYSSQTITAGYCGHPHPLALRKYEARGWKWRFNTSSRARHRGLQGDPDRRHSFGATSLGWNSRFDCAPPTEEARWKCDRCGKSMRVFG